MTLLLIYVGIALGVSFLCSIAEAVLLSVSTAYTTLLEKQGRPAGARLKELKENIDRPLAAILTLNTIAHTVGAAGAGAQATVVFGSGMLGVFSAVLTFLILVFSEIIPKTLGAYYWRQLAPPMAHLLHWMVRLLYPFVMLSNGLTQLIAGGKSPHGPSREEFAVMAQVVESQGELDDQESRILHNLLELRNMRVRDVMTPRPVIFSLPQQMTVEECFEEHAAQPFSRIPVYADNQEDITGFVLRSDLVSARGTGDLRRTLAHYRRPLPALLGAINLLRALEAMVEERVHMLLVVDEYGGVDGVVTMEDIFEALLGVEIVDEKDRTVDLQKLARRLARDRNRSLGVEDEADPG